MKKIVVIAVLLIFLLNTMGYYIVFKCSQFRVKREMISQIRMGVFHPGIMILKISRPEQNSQFRRIEKNEFSWNGKFYDVVVESKSGDTTLFYCLRDKKEETLLADFTLYFNRTMRSGPASKGNPIPALLHNLISQALLQNIRISLTDEGISFVFPLFKTPIVPVYLVHFAPPPEIT